LGYDRSVPYGQPTPTGLFPTINPSTLVANLSTAIGQGVHNALADIGVRSHKPSSPVSSLSAASPSMTIRAAAATSSAARAHPAKKRPKPTSAAATSTVADIGKPSTAASAPAGASDTPATHGDSPKHKRQHLYASHH